MNSKIVCSCSRRIRIKWLTKFLVGLIIVSCFLWCALMKVNAERSVIIEGQGGDSVFWKVYDDGTMEITGEGMMYDDGNEIGRKIIDSGVVITSVKVLEG